MNQEIKKLAIKTAETLDQLLDPTIQIADNMDYFFQLDQRTPTEQTLIRNALNNIPYNQPMQYVRTSPHIVKTFLTKLLIYCTQELINQPEQLELPFNYPQRSHPKLNFPPMNDPYNL